jgi:hypothetical protein
MVGLSGLEPLTSRLSGVRSNQLSYRPTAPACAGSSPWSRDLLAFDRIPPGSRPVDPRGEKTSPADVGRARSQLEAPEVREQRTFLNAREARPRIWPTGRIRRPGLPRKEVIQPHLPVRLPCYDLAPITGLTLGGCLLTVGTPTSGTTNFRGLTGGVYKARERIHRCLLISDY